MMICCCCCWIAYWDWIDCCCRAGWNCLPPRYLNILSNHDDIFMFLPRATIQSNHPPFFVVLHLRAHIYIYTHRHIHSTSSSAFAVGWPSSAASHCLHLASRHQFIGYAQTADVPVPHSAPQTCIARVCGLDCSASSSRERGNDQQCKTIVSGGSTPGLVVVVVMVLF